MNKMAVCVLAHKDPKQLNRLVKALDSQYFDIFIHLDKKSDIALFKIEIESTTYSEVVFVPKRYKIKWGDISIVDATLETMKFAVDFGKSTSSEYKRFICLSGLDYPIKSNEEIYKTLNNDTEFIMGNKLEATEFHKLECCHIWKSRILHRISNKVYKVFKYHYREKYYINADGNKMDVYFSPQWHALSFQCVTFILDFVTHNKNYRRFFKYSYAPDELFIPTIVFNSPFRSKTLRAHFPINTHYNEKTAIHYINYGARVETFDESHINDIVDSNKLFVRKVESHKSEKLMSLLDNLRIRNNF